MPEPMGRGQRYMPGLDGLRAVAVLAVVAFHLGFGWASGGLLGVGVFFTLSGYLITDLLLGEWHSSGGHLQLRDFWMRRARRLLPALFVMLAVVVVWVAVADRSELGALRGDAASATLYVNNWWLIFHHVSYFARFGPPSPLGNLWSLAVEEQFYLLWPWLLLAGLLWAGWSRGWIRSSGRDPLHARGDRARWTRRSKVLVIAILAAAALSAAEMALLYHPSLDPTRVYDGTDTRAFGLLFGAALAMVWPSRSLTGEVTAGARWLIDALGALGLVGIALLVWGTNQYSPFLYQGGMVLLSLATLLVVVAATHPASRVGRLLGWGPLRWIGLISYGIYLWHYPIIVLTTPTENNGVTASGTSGVDLPRAAVQMVAIVVVAALSWKFVETPIRHGALGRLWGQIRSQSRRLGAVPGQAWAAGTASLVVLGFAGLGLLGALPTAPVGTLAATKASTVSLGSSSSRVIHLHPTTTTAPATTTKAPGVPTTPASPAPGGFAAAKGTTATSAPPLTTSCSSVVHVGDSTSESLISSSYLSPSQQLPAQYARVGVSNVNLQISGARSIVETYQGQSNGQQVAQQLISQGYHGCWVIALGTNDAADVAAGSNVGMAARIQRMMSTIGNQPVLWVNVISLLTSGPYADSGMQQWDQALVQACSQYPNMRVFDWASIAQPTWFISDGIHYNSAGSAVRAADIADALAYAFPAAPAQRSSRGDSAGCVVH